MRVRLPRSGASASVSADVQPETISALDEMMQAAREHSKALVEELRLRRLTNEELVIECLDSDAWEHPVVQELCNRLYPGWADPKELVSKE